MSDKPTTMTISETALGTEDTATKAVPAITIQTMRRSDVAQLDEMQVGQALKLVTSEDAIILGWYKLEWKDCLLLQVGDRLRWTELGPYCWDIAQRQRALKTADDLDSIDAMVGGIVASHKAQFPQLFLR